jgi:hypothetical protein
MRNRQDAGIPDLRHCCFESSSGLPGSADCHIAPCRSLVGETPRSMQIQGHAAGTQCQGRGTAHQGGCVPDEGNSFTEGLCHVLRGAAALVRLSLPDSRPPFADLRHSLRGLSRSQQPQRKSYPNITLTLSNAQSCCKQELEVQHQYASAQPCRPSRPDTHSARSGAQGDMPQPVRKRRRRSSVPFACASAGAAAAASSPGASASNSAGASAGTDDGPSPEEWRWPQLPKWKPPRYRRDSSFCN